MLDGDSDREGESSRRSPQPRGRCGSRPAPRGGRAGTPGTSALAHLLPRAGQATYSEPRAPIVLSRAVLPARSRRGELWPWLRGARAPRAPGAGARRTSAPAEPRRAGLRGPRLPSSRLRRGRCSGRGALRLRTFHSSFHAPSPAQSPIGSAKSDVSASSPSRPRPSPARDKPERATGAPLPLEAGSVR